MSETVRYKGILDPISIPEEHNNSLHDQCDYLRSLEELSLPEWFSGDDYWSEVVYLINGVWYKNTQERLDIDFDFCEVDVHTNGQIHYHTVYYNGGASTEAMLEDALKKKEY